VTYWNQVKVGDQVVATLEPGSKRPALARDNWRVLGMDGKVLGYVRRSFAGIRWRINYERAVYGCRERALEELLRRHRLY